MKYIHKLSQIFLVAWLLNLLWENVHVLLYEHYQGMVFAQISQLEKFVILLQASIFDGAFITGAVLVGTLLSKLFKSKQEEKTTMAFLLGVSIAFAMTLEMNALESGRWAYNELMPIIPFLNVGLTPTIQLALTGYLAYRSACKN